MKKVSFVILFLLCLTSCSAEVKGPKTEEVKPEPASYKLTLKKITEENKEEKSGDIIYFQPNKSQGLLASIQTKSTRNTCYYYELTFDSQREQKFNNNQVEKWQTSAWQPHQGGNVMDVGQHKILVKQYFTDGAKEKLVSKKFFNYEVKAE